MSSFFTLDRDLHINFMKKYFFVLILLLSLSIAACSQEKPAIFRSISLNNGKELLLGGDVAPIQDLLIKTDTNYSLKPRTFGGAESINILLAGNRVRAIFFEYSANKNFEETATSFVQSLGKPTSKQSFISESLRAEVIAWEDSETQFELVKRIEQEKVLIFSALFDKKLYK